MLIYSLCYLELCGMSSFYAPSIPSFPLPSSLPSLFKWRDKTVFCTIANDFQVGQWGIGKF